MHLRSNAAYTMVKISLSLFINMQDVLETQLRSHVVQAHKMADYRFQCEYCPKRLDTKQHMRNHVRFVKNNFLLSELVLKNIIGTQLEVFDLVLFTVPALLLPYVPLKVHDLGAGIFFC
jgi:hypothetical protein